jgi:hypothetical protein
MWEINFLVRDKKLLNSHRRGSSQKSILSKIEMQTENIEDVFKMISLELIRLRKIKPQV